MLRILCFTQIGMNVREIAEVASSCVLTHWVPGIVHVTEDTGYQWTVLHVRVGNT